MATEDVTIKASDGWVEVAEATENFLVESFTLEKTFARFADAEPDEDLFGYIIEPGSSFVRPNGVEGALWIRTLHPTDIILFVSVGTP